MAHEISPRWLYISNYYMQQTPSNKTTDVACLLRITAGDAPFDRFAVEGDGDPVDLQQGLSRGEAQKFSILWACCNSPQCFFDPVDGNSLGVWIMLVKRMRHICSATCL